MNMQTHNENFANKNKFLFLKKRFSNKFEKKSFN